MARSVNSAQGRRSAQGVASFSCRSRGASSAETGQLTHLVIGRVVAPRGLGGELKVAIETDQPDRFLQLRKVYLGDGLACFKVQRARLHRGQALLQLQGIADRNAAEAWRGAHVSVSMQDALPLEEGEYYCHQIEGLDAVTTEGERLGRVTGVLATGANDVYVVRGDQGELLLPAVKDVIVRVDLEAGMLVVRLPEGLR